MSMSICTTSCISNLMWPFIWKPDGLIAEWMSYNEKICSNCSHSTETTIPVKGNWNSMTGEPSFQTLLDVGVVNSIAVWTKCPISQRWRFNGWLWVWNLGLLAPLQKHKNINNLSWDDNFSWCTHAVGKNIHRWTLTAARHSFSVLTALYIH